jgi:RHS repeat-associated protein
MLGEWALDGQLYKNSRKFTGYDRDWTTGLDNAKARMYAGKVGKFMQPDPLGAAAVDPGNPQSLNRYRYVGNDPANFCR